MSQHGIFRDPETHHLLVRVLLGFVYDGRGGGNSYNLGCVASFELGYLDSYVERPLVSESRTRSGLIPQNR